MIVIVRVDIKYHQNSLGASQLATGAARLLLRRNESDESPRSAEAAFTGRTDRSNQAREGRRHRGDWQACRLQ